MEMTEFPFFQVGPVSPKLAKYPQIECLHLALGLRHFAGVVKNTLAAHDVV